MNEAGDDSSSISSVPDPYDMVYNKLPTGTHMLKPVEDCKHCGAKRFEHESKGFCCRNGKIKLANPDTPPELMRLWTSADLDARHFRDNIRFLMGISRSPHYIVTLTVIPLTHLSILSTRFVLMVKCITTYDH